MPVPLDPGDRTLLIVAGVLLVLVSLAGMLFAPHTETASAGFPSSYSASSDGAKAAYLLLEELGYRVERWSKPPNELPAGAQNVSLVLAEPFLPPTPEEKYDLRHFLERGGRVLATGASAALLLPNAHTEPVVLSSVEWQAFPARLPGPISRRAPNISMQSSSRWKGGASDARAYYGDKKGGTVISYNVGPGSVVWWAAASPLTNYGLTQASNVELLLNSLGAGKNTRVLWDEYYHGQRAGFWDYVARTPLPWALIQAGLLMAALVLTYSRRSGPVVLPAAESRLSPLEFVETVGDLYACKRAGAGAVEIAYHGFRSLLAKRLGLPWDASHDSIQRAIQERGGWAEPGLAGLLARCERFLGTGAPDESQALRLVQELHDYTRRLRL
jgi:hypothetical protein